MRMEIFWRVNGRAIISAKVTYLLKEMRAIESVVYWFHLFFIKGKFCFVDGDIYEGRWKDGLMQGIGNLIELNLII